MSQDQDCVEPALEKPAELLAEPIIEPEASGLASREDEVEYDTEPTGLRRWLSHPKAPLVVAGAVLIGVVAVFWPKLTMPSIGSPRMVVFDPVRFVNAQRAAASILASNPNQNGALMLTQVAAQAEAVIRDEARGAVVLVKQTVVASDLPDITDAVLDRFGLMKNVPTVKNSMSDALEDIAPSDSAFSAGKLREDYRLELQAKAAQLSHEAKSADNQAKVLP